MTDPNRDSLAERAAGLMRRWPPRHPDRIQLYSQPSPNGVKVSIILEECSLPYDAHRIEFGERGTRSADYLAANPNGKIPLILDPAGPTGEPVLLSESNAILVYLADKTGRFLATAGAARYQTLQWLFWQASALGPAFGQIGYYHRFAGREIADKRPLEANVVEARRVLGVLNARVERGPWIMGDDFTIADIASLGWVRNLIGFYDAGDLVGFRDFDSVAAWLERGLGRAAVIKGLAQPPAAAPSTSS